MGGEGLCFFMNQKLGGDFHPPHLPIFLPPHFLPFVQSLPIQIYLPGIHSLWSLQPEFLPTAESRVRISSKPPLLCC